MVNSINGSSSGQNITPELYQRVCAHMYNATQEEISQRNFVSQPIENNSNHSSSFLSNCYNYILSYNPCSLYSYFTKSWSSENGSFWSSKNVINVPSDSNENGKASSVFKRASDLMAKTCDYFKEIRESIELMIYYGD